MKTLKSLTLAALTGSFLAACAGQGRIAEDLGPLQTLTTSVGTVIADPSGMTLYTYKEDPEGESTCNGRCARKWMPMRALPGAVSRGRLSVIERKDGIRQYAYNGRPLYRWSKDKQPGDVSGHKLGEVWYVARP